MVKSPYTPLRRTVGANVLHSFVNAALGGGMRPTSGPGRFTSGEELQYPLNERLGKPQSRSACFGEEKGLLVMPAIAHLTAQHRSTASDPNRHNTRYLPARILFLNCSTLKVKTLRPFEAWTQRHIPQDQTPQQRRNVA